VPNHELQFRHYNTVNRGSFGNIFVIFSEWSFRESSLNLVVNVDLAFGRLHYVEVGCCRRLEEHTASIIRAEMRTVV
jgi:hypothetical protein